MRLVVGLGNPGSAYAGTRHNIGFAVVEELARRWKMPLGAPRHGVRMAQGIVDGERAMLVEPQMYMNVSGAALAQLEPPVSTRELIVIHDDIDLECGRVKVKRGGGTGGHRGLESIAEHYGSDFIRVRLGVGRPPCGHDAAAYVLSPFDPAESVTIINAVQYAADAVEHIVRYGEEAAMNCFNVRSSGSPAAAPMGRK
jgi:PTH1 family peptidyl-tRNA hydrolase